MILPDKFGSISQAADRHLSTEIAATVDFAMKTPVY